MATMTTTATVPAGPAIDTAPPRDGQLTDLAVKVDQYAKAILQTATTANWQEIVGHTAEEVATLIKSDAWKDALAKSALLDLFDDYKLAELQSLIDTRLQDAGLQSTDLSRAGFWDANGDFDIKLLTGEATAGTELTLTANGGQGASRSAFVRSISRPGARMLLPIGSNPALYGPITKNSPEDLGGGEMSLMSSTGGEGTIYFLDTPQTLQEGSGYFAYRLKLSSLATGGGEGFTDGGYAHWEFVAGEATMADFDSSTSVFSGDTSHWLDGAEGDILPDVVGPFYPINDTFTEGGPDGKDQFGVRVTVYPDGPEGPHDEGPDAVGYITDPPPISNLPVVSIDDAPAVYEGGRAAFRVTRSGSVIGTTTTTTVAFSTNDDTATVAGNDYASQSGSVVFAPGETEKWVYVTTNADSNTTEGTEYFHVDLTPSTSDFTLSDPQGVGTIINRTGSTTMPEVTIDHADPVFEGGVAQFTVTRSGNTTYTTIVPWNTANITAAAPEDYVGRNEFLIFAPSETVKTITIQTNINEDDHDFDEQFSVNLASGSDYTLDEYVGIGTILEDSDDDRRSKYKPCICYCVCGQGDSTDLATGANLNSVQTVGGFAMNYNSDSVSKYTMSFDWTTPAYSGSPIYELVKAEFTLGSLGTQTVWYDASSFPTGDTMHITMQTDASSLASGSYGYTTKLTLIDEDEIAPSFTPRPSWAIRRSSTARLPPLDKAGGSKAWISSSPVSRSVSPSSRLGARPTCSRPMAADTTAPTASSPTWLTTVAPTPTR